MASSLAAAFHALRAVCEAGGQAAGCRPWLAEFKGRPGKKLPDLTNARRAQMPVLYGQGRTQGHWQFRAAPIYLGCHKRVIVSM